MSIAVTITVPEAGAVARHFDSLVGQTAARTRSVVVHYGQLLQTRVMAKASGRPGPRTRSGDYRRSISLQVGMDPGVTFTAAVGTSEPQGRRLELGFVGRDALGRDFEQPPYPHFGPALDEIEESFVAALDMITEAL